MRQWLLLGLPALLAVPLVTGSVWQAAQKPAAPKPLKHGPLAYYRDHCQRCHGAFGGAYEDNFTKGKTAKELTDVIESMAAGQGGSPLTDEKELQAQVAFHYAIDLKKPFLTWTAVDGSRVSGEVTPDAKLRASVAGTDAPVTVTDGVWHVTLPAGGDPNNLVITATLGDAKSTLDLSKSAYSNTGPEKKGTGPPTANR